MTKKHAATMRAIVLVLGIGIGTAAVAQSTLKSSSPESAIAAPDSKTMSTYKKTTWQRHQTTLKAPGSTREIPPTDCPPLPAQDCLDTWDDEMTTQAKPD